MPAYPGVDVDHYVKMCNSAPDHKLRCNVLQSFAIATFNNLDNIIPSHNCREFNCLKKLIFFVNSYYIQKSKWAISPTVECNWL